MRSRAPGRSPAKMAMATAVAIAASAATGGRKNVTGTSSATATVADTPGMAPVKRPNRQARKMTSRTSKVKTSSNAAARFCIMRLQPAAQKTRGQRHAQRIDEHELERQRERDREHGRRQHVTPATRRRKQSEYDHRAHRHEAEGLRCEDVKQHAGNNQAQHDPAARLSCPRL